MADSEEYDVIDLPEADMGEDSASEGDFEMTDEEDVEDTSFFSIQFPESALCLAVSPVDPFRVCVGCLDNSARILIVDSVGVPQEPIDLQGHSDSVVSVGFSNDGALVATGSYDCSIRIWSASTGSLIHVIEETQSDIEILHWHPTMTVLSAGCADGSIWVWEVTESEFYTKYMFRGHSHGASVRALEYIGLDGLVSGTEEGVCILWNLKTGLHSNESKNLQGSVLCISAHKERPLYAVGTENGFVYIFHAGTGKVLHKIAVRGSVESVKFSPCGSLLGIATLEGVLEIWQVEQLSSGYPRHRIDLCKMSPEAGSTAPHMGDESEDQSSIGITKILWHPDPTTRCVLTVGKSGAVDLWNAMTGEHLASLSGNRADVLDAVMTRFADPQQREVARIVTACDEGFVRMFTVSLDS